MNQRLKIEVTQAYAGEPVTYHWMVSRNIGGVSALLASGSSMTGYGALYAATMEARLHDPEFGRDQVSP